MVTVSTAVLQAYGPLQQTAEDADIDIAMQTDITTGAAMEVILDAAGYSADDRDIDTGHSTMSRFWARKGRVLELLRELEEEETGLLRETKDGKIQLEDRGHRAAAPHTTVRSTYGTGVLRPYDPQQTNPLLDIYNSIEAKVRVFNKSELVTLATIVDVRNGTGGPPIPFANGETKVIDIEFPTPSSPSQYLAVESWEMLPPCTHANADETGADLTNAAGMTMSRQDLGRTLRCTFVNGTGSAGYFTRLSVVGTAIVEGDPLTVSAEDATSISKYGKRLFPSPSQWLTELAEGQDYCDHRIALFKDPCPALRFTLKANYDPTHLAEAQAIDVSDRIHITASLATFGLALDSDFFIEYLKHSVNEARLHEVQVYCRAIVAHVWAASAPTYTAKEIPAGVPDDLYTTAIDPEMRIVCGARAWKYNANITGARFRAKWYANELGADEYADLRTVAEGGTFDETSPSIGIIEDDLFANEFGAQYDWVSAVEGVWYFAFQFKSKAGDSVWSDGNRTPCRVTDHVHTDPAGYATGPPSDWWVEVDPDPSGRHAVIVRASRPKVNGHKIWSVRFQIKDVTTYPFYPINYDIYGDGGSGDVQYGFQIPLLMQSMYPPPADASPYWREHTLTNDGRRFTRTDGVGLLGQLDHMDGDWVRPGELILFDPRGAVWDRRYCQWGTVYSVQGLTWGYDPATATHFDVAGRFRSDVTSNLRLLVIRPPWELTSKGYLGAEGNQGLWAKEFWDTGGDTETEVFVSEPIDVPASLDLSDVGGRVWFDNGFSVDDNDVYAVALFGDSGNPSGASGLVILTPETDSTIPPGMIAFRFNRDTSNYRGIYSVAAVLSTALPAEGPYSTERAGHADEIIETGTCTVIAGNKSVSVTTAVASGNEPRGQGLLPDDSRRHARRERDLGGIRGPRRPQCAIQQIGKLQLRDHQAVLGYRQRHRREPAALFPVRRSLRYRGPRADGLDDTAGSGPLGRLLRDGLFSQPIRRRDQAHGGDRQHAIGPYRERLHCSYHRSQRERGHRLQQQSADVLS